MPAILMRNVSQLTRSFTVNGATHAEFRVMFDTKCGLGDLFFYYHANMLSNTTLKLRNFLFNRVANNKRLQMGNMGCSKRNPKGI